VNSCYSDEKWAEELLGKFASLEKLRDLGNGCGVTSISVWIAMNPDDGLEYMFTARVQTAFTPPPHPQRKEDGFCQTLMSQNALQSVKKAHIFAKL